MPLDEDAGSGATAVHDAEVRIQLLGTGDTVEQEYVYEYTSQGGGLYRMRAGDLGVAVPLRKFRLIVDVPDYPQATSTTLVPDTFAVRSSGTDSVVYQSDEPFTFELTGPRYPGRQNFFVFTTTAIDGFEHQLTPFARRILEDADDVTIADLREQVSPILNEESFDRTDGVLRISFPWLGVNFYGRNRVAVEALDDNLYDFIRSQSVQQGGSTRPPGEIPNVLDSIENGRGVFGSYAEASVDFFVFPPDG